MVSRESVSGEVDGATAEAHELDVTANLTTDGAKLLSIKNAGVEVWSVDKDGISTGSFVQIVKPAQGQTGIQTALNAVKAAGGGIVQLLTGSYNITSQIKVSDGNGVILQGVGEGTVLEVDDTVPFVGDWVLLFSSLTTPNGHALNNTTTEDTSIFTTTPGDAINYSQGATIFIRGLDANSEEDWEVVEAAAAGNPSNGEITLVNPVMRTMTGVVVASSFQNGRGNAVRNLKFKHVAGAGAAWGLRMSHCRNFVVENVIFEDLLNDGLSIQVCSEGVIKRCIARNLTGSGVGIGVGSSNNIVVEGCLVDNVKSGIQVAAPATNTVVRNNHARTTTGNGIKISAFLRTLRRIAIVDNLVQDTSGEALLLVNSGGNIIDVQLNNNTITDCASAFIISGAAIINNIQLRDNTFKRCAGALKNIWVQKTNRFQFENNIIDNCDGGALIVEFTSDDFIISNNVFKNSSGPAWPVIYIGTGCNRGVISGNNIEGSATKAIWLAGTSTGHLISNNLFFNNTSTDIFLDNTISNCLVIGNNLPGGSITEGTGSNTFVSNIS